MTRLLTYLTLLACALTAQAGNIIGPAGQWAWYSRASSYTFPAASSIVLRWDFAASNSVQPDTSAVGTNSGAVNGAVWYSTSSGRYSFDGVNDSITNANTALCNAATALTVHVWIFGATNGVDIYDAPVSCFESAAPWSGFFIDYRNAGGTQIGGLVSDSDGNYSLAACTAGDFALNAWHHVVYTWKKTLGDNHIYIDGVEKTASPTENADNNLSQTIGLTVGEDPSSAAQWYAGFIGQIVIWKNWEAASSDVTNIWNGTKGVY